jgi:hypothetical protein
MSSIRIRKTIMDKVSMFMLEKGKILSKREYERTVGTPVRLASIRRHFGDYQRMVYLMRENMPEWAKEINSLENKVEDPLAALKSGNFSKASEAVESIDE